MIQTNTKNISNGTMISVSGNLDGQGAEMLAKAMTGDLTYTLDFNEVESISFAALRALLNCRKSGIRFCIVNASDSVAERIEDTGVSTFISTCRKPKALDLGKYDEFGGSFLSKSFNSKDGDSMIKVYGPRMPKELVAQEKAVAKAVMVFGIPTPLVGTLYEDESGAMALDFERIEGKRSFSRVIADQPERLEEMSIRFAKMCKKLHTTPCDTVIFGDRSRFYRQAIVNCKEITDEEKEKALAFLNNVPQATTCLHGDMQLSNVITNEKEDLWIDLSDFGYGNPMFDMGMWYFQAKLNVDEIVRDLFHFGNDTIAKVWDIFAKEYFGADTPEKLAEVERQVAPFAALHMLYLGSVYGFMPFMIPFIRQTLLQ